MSQLDNRRPLKSRGSAWARRLAATLAEAGASPNLISALSVAFAILGASLFLWAGTSHGVARAVVLVLAALCIQLRLACNLLDGLVAVEHGQGSPSGPIWNELPDRFADVLFLAAAGYSAEVAGVHGGVLFGWLAAVAALLTAYVRELGRGLGLPTDFSGPMAKPQRMAALTLTALIAAVEPLWHWRGQSLLIGLIIIALGGFFTVARRTLTLARRLEPRD
jgi:phosphatidylglycerophosphate synthase